MEEEIKHSFRPWGIFFTHSMQIEDKKDKLPLILKTLLISPDKRTSLQYHTDRAEFWHFLNKAKIVKENTEREHKTGDIEVIPKLTKHRLEGLNSNFETSIVQEIWVGKSSEESVKRIKDDYGRI